MSRILISFFESLRSSIYSLELLPFEPLGILNMSARDQKFYLSLGASNLKGY